MPATERYQTDIFAIIVVIASIAILVFLIVSAIYFNGIQNWTTIPGSGESIFLFWTAIVLGIIFLAIIIYGLYRIFTHRAVICPKPKTRQTVAVTTTTAPEPKVSEPKATIPVSNAKPIVEVKPQPPVVKPQPTVVKSQPTAGYPSQVASSSSTQSSLQRELIDLASEMNQ